MKEAIAMLAIAWILSLGWVLGDLSRSNDYGRGYADGYAAPHPQTPESKVVGNMLCSYAKLACGKPK